MAFVVYEFHSEDNPDGMIYEYVELHQFRTFEAADHFRFERVETPDEWVLPHWHNVYIEPIYNTMTGGSMGRRMNVELD